MQSSFGLAFLATACSATMSAEMSAHLAGFYLREEALLLYIGRIMPNYMQTYIPAGRFHIGEKSQVVFIFSPKCQVDPLLWIDHAFLLHFKPRFFEKNLLFFK